MTSTKETTTQKIAEKDEAIEVAVDKEKSLSKRFFSFVKELLILVVIAFILAFIFKTFVFQPFKVEMSSMTPTVLPKDRVLVNKFIYYFSNPKRGDIVTVYSPEKYVDTGFSIRNLFSSPRKILIKRVIATEGETIEIKNGDVYIDNKIIKEKYVSFKDFNGFGPLKVSKNKVFFMGDNRPNSKDSRSFGMLDVSEILGKAAITYWPPAAFKILRN